MPSRANSAAIGADLTGDALGVDAVDRRLVRLPPGPERQRRRRGQEGPAREPGIGGLQAEDERLVAAEVPLQKFVVVVGPVAGELGLLLDRHLRRPPLRDVAHRPAVHLAGVAEQIADAPARRRRHRHVDRVHGGGVGEEQAVPAQGIDVVGYLHAPSLSPDPPTHAA